jgi:hypothetical protein
VRIHKLETVEEGATGPQAEILENAALDPVTQGPQTITMFGRQVVTEDLVPVLFPTHPQPIWGLILLLDYLLGRRGMQLHAMGAMEVVGPNKVERRRVLITL